MSGKKPILPKSSVSLPKTAAAPPPEPEQKVKQEEKALRSLRRRSRDAGPGVHKTSIEIPREYYDLIEQELAENYETFKGFIMRLVKKHFDEKQAK